MDSKLYVGNLSHETTETQLQVTLFSEAGEVTSGQDHHRPTNRSAPRLRLCGDGNQTGRRRRPFPCLRWGWDGDLTVDEAKPQQKSGFGGGGYRH